MFRKIVLALLLFLSGAVSALWLVDWTELSRGVWAGAGPGDPPASCMPGDVNGDSRFNISDPVFLLARLFGGGPRPQSCTTEIATPEAYFVNALDTTTVVVVRHAEKDIGLDPGLTEKGHARARRLAEILAAAPVTHLFSSNLRRTKETLGPLALSTALDIEPIANVTDVVARLEGLERGTLAVVAHHSFTVHAILEGLGVDDSREINVNGGNYDNLFIVVRDDSAGAQLVHLKY